MTTPHPILAARPARTVPGVEGSVRQEPAYIDGRLTWIRKVPLMIPDRRWSATDHMRREDRLFAQGWHDAGGGK